LGKKAAAEWSTHAERRSISPRNLPRTIRGVAVDEGGAGADNIVMMLDRYTLLYGTKTVWDAEKRTVIAYDAMALARGSDLASRWIGHPMHREVDLDRLVFDPTQKCDLESHINMFEGFPLKPVKDEAKAKLALGLLYSLCSSEANCDEIFHWVLSWLAYPLQNPGAKMQTALLFFGEKQGTGKSLFFEGIVKPIYGAHGATGGQHQLEAQYTHWRSQKLFVLFEEILSRQDKYSHFGLIKHMITGRDMPISQKFKDDRTEANHMNVVMLSNEFQAVPIEPEDRRFQVAEARNPLDPLLLADIRDALDNGLSAAFYAFLLEYPLGDFTPHTKPVMTSSKERMINFGRPDWEAFYLTWAAGELSVPYSSCLSEDLYVIYARYCNKYGFRALTITKFAELIAQRVKKDRQWVTIGSASKRLLTVFHVPQPEGEEVKRLSDQCNTFRNLADIKGMV
jgi:putative DNA primase/helicase